MDDPEYLKYLDDLERDGKELMCMETSVRDEYFPIWPHVLVRVRVERRKK